MEKVTYAPGQLSQIKLEDGSRFLIHIIPNKILATKLLFGVIPIKSIWSYNSPLLTRTGLKPSSFAINILDIVLKSIEDCHNKDELLSSLEKKASAKINGILKIQGMI